MKINIKIQDVKSVNSLKGYWSDQDIVAILDLLDYPDAGEADPAELQELLAMAVSDFEATESAEKVLGYKLGTMLRAGQIENIAHDMIEDKIAEEYPDIALHYDLYNINQLLFKAYNGVFPNTLATVINFELKLQDNTIPVTKEVVIKAIFECLSDKNPLVRLFDDQIKSEQPFAEAENIIWELRNSGENQYTMVTSNYWIAKEDIVNESADTSITLSDHDDE